jgi:hypothetical protein
MARLGDRLREKFFRWVLDLPLERAHEAGLRLLKENLSTRQRYQLRLAYRDIRGRRVSSTQAFHNFEAAAFGTLLTLHECSCKRFR